MLQLALVLNERTEITGCQGMNVDVVFFSTLPELLHQFNLLVEIGANNTVVGFWNIVLYLPGRVEIDDKTEIGRCAPLKRQRQNPFFVEKFQKAFVTLIPRVEIKEDTNCAIEYDLY